MIELHELLASKIEFASNKRNKMLFVVLNRYTFEELQNNILQMEIPVLNVSLLLSEQLRQFPSERRPFEVGKILRSLVMQEDKDIILLSNIEYLFDRELKQNPVRLFENMSGNKTIIINWSGTFDGGILKYATPEHHEYYQSDNSYESYIIEI